MYYGMQAFDDFDGLGAAKPKTAEQCAKIQAKIDAIQAKQKSGGTTAQLKTWDRQVTNQTKLLNKCLASAGLPAADESPVGVPEAAEVADAAAAAGKFSPSDLAKAAALVGSGKLSPETEAMVKKALGVSDGEVGPVEMSATTGRGPRQAGSKDELIWGIPKGVVYVLGSLVGIGIVMTLLLQKRGGSSTSTGGAQ